MADTFINNLVVYTGTDFDQTFVLESEHANSALYLPPSEEVNKTEMSDYNNIEEAGITGLKDEAVGEMTIDDDRFPIEAGDAILIEDGVFHQVHNTGHLGLYFVFLIQEFYFLK